MRKELQRIEPWSVVKVTFFLGLGLGFLAGLFYGFLLKGAAETTGEVPFFGLTWAGVLLGALLCALAGSIFYAILGGVASALYNLIARRFGGIEVQVTDERSETSSFPRESV